MKKVMLLAAMLAMVLTAAAPVMAQNGNIVVDDSGNTDTQYQTQNCSVIIQQYNAAVSGDATATGNAAVAATAAEVNAPVDVVQNCIQAGGDVNAVQAGGDVNATAPSSSSSAAAAAAAAPGSSAAAAAPASGAAGSAAAAPAAGAAAAAPASEAAGLSVLPDTGGASLIALGAGALLVAGGLLARRIVR